MENCPGERLVLGRQHAALMERFGQGTGKKNGLGKCTKVLGVIMRQLISSIMLELYLFFANLRKNANLSLDLRCLASLNVWKFGGLVLPFLFAATGWQWSHDSARVGSQERRTAS